MSRIYHGESVRPTVEQACLAECFKGLPRDFCRPKWKYFFVSKGYYKSQQDPR